MQTLVNALEPYVTFHGSAIPIDLPSLVTEPPVPPKTPVSKPSSRSLHGAYEAKRATELVDSRAGPSRPLENYYSVQPFSHTPAPPEPSPNTALRDAMGPASETTAQTPHAMTTGQDVAVRLETPQEISRWSLDTEDLPSAPGQLRRTLRFGSAKRSVNTPASGSSSAAGSRILGPIISRLNPSRAEEGPYVDIDLRPMGESVPAPEPAATPQVGSVRRHWWQTPEPIPYQPEGIRAPVSGATAPMRVIGHGVDSSQAEERETNGCCDIA